MWRGTLGAMNSWKPRPKLRCFPGREGSGQKGPSRVMGTADAKAGRGDSTGCLQDSSREHRGEGARSVLVQRLRPKLEGTWLSCTGLALILEVTERSVILGKMKGKLHNQLPLWERSLSKQHKGGGETGDGETTAAYASSDSLWWGLPEGHPGMCLKAQPPLCSCTHL